jgi:hypothetical protein
MTTTATRPDAGRGRAAIVARTLRTDRWWFPTLITFLGLTAWVIYAVVRVYMHKWYFVEQYHYLTPFYSPCLTDRCVEGASEFGTPLPAWWIIPEAAFSLPFLLLFRLTCYYYRKAYYRAFWLSPPACAVPDAHAKYTGETRFPLIFQNIHRYAFYAAGIISLINTWDAIRAFQSPAGSASAWQHHPGRQRGDALGVHVVLPLLPAHRGGRLKHFSKHPMRYRFWTFVSKLNTSTCSSRGSPWARSR